jgi:hypothetical protein
MGVILTRDRGTKGKGQRAKVKGQILNLVITLPRNKSGQNAGTRERNQGISICLLTFAL